MTETEETGGQEKHCRETAGPDEVGDPPCWLNRLCPECGAMLDSAPPTVCPRCAAEVRPEPEA